MRTGLCWRLEVGMRLRLPIAALTILMLSTGAMILWPSMVGLLSPFVMILVLALVMDGAYSWLGVRPVVLVTKARAVKPGKKVRKARMA